MIQIFSQYISLKTLTLSALETCVIAAAVVCSAKLRFWSDPVEFDNLISHPDFASQLLVIVLVFQACFHFAQVYDRKSIRNRPDEMLRVTQAIGASAILLGLLYTVYPGLLIGRGVFLISMVVIAGLILFDRIVLDQAWRFAVPPENILILGAGPLALIAARELKRRSDLNLHLTGFVTTETEGENGKALPGSYPVCGSAGHLKQIAEELDVSRIIVALSDRRGSLPTQDLVRLRVQGVQIEDAHSIIAALTGRVWLETVSPSWFVFSDGFHRSKFTLLLKRLIDFCCALSGLILAGPVMVAIAVAIRLGSEGPAIYRQERIGARGRTFNVLKFRSMKINAEEDGARWAQRDDPRVTRIGAFLRKYRLDELPQLINVLKGDMSFVGPRPERPCFVDQLRAEIPYYDERHSVRPGITGWAQVQYHYGSTVEDAKRKLEYDLFYLKNLSSFFDLSIIMRTIRVVLTGAGSR